MSKTGASHAFCGNISAPKRYYNRMSVASNLISVRLLYTIASVSHNIPAISIVVAPRFHNRDAAHTSSMVILLFLLGTLFVERTSPGAWHPLLHWPSRVGWQAPLFRPKLLVGYIDARVSGDVSPS